MSIVDDYRAKFWKVKDALDALDAKLQPIIDMRDKLQAEFEPKLRDLSEQIKVGRAPRYDLQQELSFLAKALGDKVGERP